MTLQRIRICQDCGRSTLGVLTDDPRITHNQWCPGEFNEREIDALLVPVDGGGGNIQAATEVIEEDRRAMAELDRGAPWGPEPAADAAGRVVSAWLGIKET